MATGRPDALTTSSAGSGRSAPKASAPGLLVLARSTCASNHCARSRNAAPSGAAMTSDNGVERIAREDGVSPMKTILSALIALSVLAGFAGSAAADVDAKTFYEQADRDRF